MNGHSSSTHVRGNPCLVHLTSVAPQQAPAPAPVTQCVTWSEQPGHAEVRCWAPSGQEIQLCGHGLLCSGHHWHGRWQMPTHLKMGDEEVLFEQDEGVDWLGFPDLETRPVAIPPWVNGLLGQTPRHAAIAGPEGGYLVLETDPDCELATLPPPGDALAAHSRRSLILTRRVTAGDARCGENIQLRYFAPQWGNPEDTATGSAMRVLAAYWQQRGAGDALRALQCSRDGGWLLSRIAQGRTWVGGRVIDDTEELA